MQTTVNVDMAAGIPGEMATTRPRYCYAVIAAENVTLGGLAYLGTDGKFYAAAAEGRTLKGVFVSPHQHVQMKLADGSASLVVPAGQEVGLLERGEVFVKVASAVTAGGDFNGIGVYLKAGAANDIVPVRLG